MPRGSLRRDDREARFGSGLSTAVAGRINFRRNVSASAKQKGGKKESDDEAIDGGELDVDEDFDDAELAEIEESGENEIENGGANSSTGALDFNYAGCRATGPVPLTEDKDTLITHVQSMSANGGTAGHLGVAWGWYLVSPNWADIWPETSQPWNYDEVHATKVVILMTDGDFNSNHPSASKGSFAQAMDLCDAMKAEPSNVQIYTVGFQVPSNVQKTAGGETILEYCATTPAYAFDASNGDELKDVYREIARSISNLRIKQ